MANVININITEGCTIKIESHDKVYPISCPCAKLKLRRSYKAICKFCLSTTSTFNKNRIGICPECEEKLKLKKLFTTCYLCNQNDDQFEKTNKGFICQDCIRENREEFTIQKYCPICEYEVFTNKKGIHLCDHCKSGNVRKSRILRENRVLCCNCEQVAIQLNPRNNNVYCNECKYELFGSAYGFERV